MREGRNRKPNSHHSQWERTPWRATQRAAWDALKQADDGELSHTSASRSRNEWSA